jgi:hypothetical protein
MSIPPGAQVGGHRLSFAPKMDAQLLRVKPEAMIQTGFDFSLIDQSIKNIVAVGGFPCPCPRSEWNRCAAAR